MTRKSVAVTIAGHDYKIRSDVDPVELRRVAGYVDAAMQKIRRQTDTHDSFDVAVLTCLNLARDILALRDRLDGAPTIEELSGLAELVESAMTAPSDGRREDETGASVETDSVDAVTDPTAAEAGKRARRRSPSDDAVAAGDRGERTEATVHSVDIHLERVAERAAEAAEAARSAEEPGALAAGEAKR